MSITSALNILRTTGLVGLICGLSTVVQAETSTWAVAPVKSVDGTMVCTADTHNDAVGVGLAMQEDGNLKLIIKKADWNFKRSRTAFLILVDENVGWAFDDAVALGKTAVFTLPNNDATVELLQAMMNGDALRVVSKSKKTIMTVGLKGSRAAIIELADCAKRFAPL